MTSYAATCPAGLPSGIAELTDRLICDIRRRGLAAGDRYLTTDEVGRMLGVRKATANLALGVLAQQQFLIRRQRSGTFIGPRFGPRPATKRPLVQVLLHPLRGWGVLSGDVLLAGLQDAFPEARVQFALLPEREPLEYLKHLIQESNRLNYTLALAPISCPGEVHRYLVQEGMPAVVLGSVQAEADALTSIDADYFTAGRLVLEYLLERKHRRFALLTREPRLPGEHSMLQGIRGALASAKLPAESLEVCSLAHDAAPASREVRRLLQSSARPTAAICGDLPMAQFVHEHAAAVGIDVPRDLLIVHEAGGPCTAARSPYVQFFRQADSRELAALIGAALRRTLDGAPLPQRHVRLPVQLREARR